MVLHRCVCVFVSCSSSHCNDNSPFFSWLCTFNGHNFLIPTSNRQAHETMNSDHDMIWYDISWQWQHGTSMTENFFFFSFSRRSLLEAEVIRHKTEERKKIDYTKKRATKHWTKLKYNLMLSNHFKSNISSGDISFFIIILCLDDANMWYTFSIRYVLDTVIIFIRSSHKLAFRVVHTLFFPPASHIEYGRLRTPNTYHHPHDDNFFILAHSVTVWLIYPSIAQMRMMCMRVVDWRYLYGIFHVYQYRWQAVKVHA